MAILRKKRRTDISKLVGLSFPKMSKKLRRMRGVSHNYCVPFGSYFGIATAKGARVFAEPFEALRRKFKRLLLRRGSIFVQLKPTSLVSLKAKDTRMGKGKGEAKYGVTFIKARKIVFEFGGIKPFLGRTLVQLARHRLSFPIHGIIRFW